MQLWDHAGRASKYPNLRKRHNGQRLLVCDFIWEPIVAVAMVLTPMIAEALMTVTVR